MATGDHDLVYDSELAIIAGSETTGATLATTLCLLANHPDKKGALQAEVDGLFTDLSEFSHQKLVGAPILEGCINEALRLYPAVPDGLQRVTPPGGAVIGGKWIPGDTLVSTHTYSIQRGKCIDLTLLRGLAYECGS